MMFYNKGMQETSKESKVYQLNVELADMKKRKKDFVKAYNEEIKRLNDEIKDLLYPQDKVELP